MPNTDNIKPPKAANVNGFFTIHQNSTVSMAKTAALSLRFVGITAYQIKISSRRPSAAYFGTGILTAFYVKSNHAWGGPEGTGVPSGQIERSGSFRGAAAAPEKPACRNKPVFLVRVVGVEPTRLRTGT